MKRELITKWFAHHKYCGPVRMHAGAGRFIPLERSEPIGRRLYTQIYLRSLRQSRTPFHKVHRRGQIRSGSRLAHLAPTDAPPRLLWIVGLTLYAVINAMQGR